MRLLAYLARGCDALDVGFCEGRVGRELYDSLGRAGDSARALLAAVRWPVPITSRIARGLAACAFRGRDADREWSLGTADFPQRDQRAFDDFVPTSDRERGKRSRAPATLAQWIKAAGKERPP